MKVKYKWSFPDRPLVEYSHLATNIFSAAKKVFIYQFYGALLDIQRNETSVPELVRFRSPFPFLVSKYNF
jgi:hypothetical protein